MQHIYNLKNYKMEFKSMPEVSKITPLRVLSCNRCNRSTYAKDGFKYGTTLYKDPLNPGLYLCDKHAVKVPWRINRPNEFKSLLSQLGNQNRGRKKIMSRMRKARA